MKELAANVRVPMCTCGAAVAALVNRRFLRWQEEKLVRAGAVEHRPRRRTA
jgi:hypothetical protein